MQERICPACNRLCYSAATTEVWRCPYCGAEMPPPVNPNNDSLDDLWAWGNAVAELIRKRQAVLLERLAELEHEQWMAWARTLMETEQLSEERRKRWQQYMVPYAELPEDVKEHDRVWARKAVAIVSEWLHGVTKDAGQGD